MTPARLLILSILVAGLQSGIAYAHEDCIEDWSVAAPVVKAEGLASVEAVTALARSRVQGDVVKVSLCMQGPRYVYRLLIRGANGRHTPLVVDAKEPFKR